MGGQVWHRHLKPLESIRGLRKKMLQKAIEQATKIVKGNLGDFTESFQSPNTENGFYWPTENVEWTTGFWTGVVWLAYELTKDEAFRKTGEIHVESFLNRIEKKIDVNYHDMDFYTAFPVLRHTKLCGNEKGQEGCCYGGRPPFDQIQGKRENLFRHGAMWGTPGTIADY